MEQLYLRWLEDTILDKLAVSSVSSKEAKITLEAKITFESVPARLLSYALH
jgi:hypothetical protein